MLSATWRPGVSVSLQKTFKDKFRITLNQSLRLEQNSTLIQQHFTELEAHFLPAKGLKLGGGYRFIWSNDDEGYEKFGRFHLEGRYKHKLQRFSLNYRLRYQNRRQLFLGEDITPTVTHGLRFRLKGGYNIKNWKWDPYLSTEIFRETEDGESSFKKMRFMLSTQYKIKKIGTISPFYGLERELTGTYPKTTYIAGFNFTFKL